ncbi:MAG: hypothetical protein C0449_10090 [Polaromonas sp.]|nr:hypothetical protein [Polaromonas sp.]MBA4260486.1 hypothetical protein [Comamonadaceae bacterium]
MAEGPIKGLIAALTDPPGAAARPVADAVGSLLSRRKTLAPEEGRKLLDDLVAVFEAYATRNRGRLHLAGKAALVEEEADLLRAASGGSKGAAPPGTPPKAKGSEPSASELAALARKAQFARFSALVRDASVPEATKVALRDVLARYYNSGLLPEHRVALGFFFSNKPFRRWGKPDHLPIFRAVGEVKARMWTLLGQQGVRGAPGFLEDVARRAAARGTQAAFDIVRASANGAARARAGTLWQRIEGRIAATPAGQLPDAATRQDMVELIGLAMAEPGGTEAVRRRFRIALRQDFGAMRQRWLDALLSPQQAALRGEVTALGIGFKAANDTSRGRRIFVEIAHDGPPVRVGIDLDHANIGFAEARDRFIDTFLGSRSLSTDALRPIFDPDNLQPLLPLENSRMIEVFRQQIRDLEAGVVGGQKAVVSPILRAEDTLTKVPEPALTRAEFTAHLQQAKDVDALRRAARQTRAQMDALPAGPVRQELIDDFEGLAFGYDL